MQELYKQLKEYGHVRPGALMAKYTTFHIGGPVQFLIEVVATEKLVALLNFLTGEGVPYFILGGGSNLLWQDEAPRFISAGRCSF
jgi:UDP-N-acetylmuramate dehydrogenase